MREVAASAGASEVVAEVLVGMQRDKKLHKITDVAKYALLQCCNAATLQCLTFTLRLLLSISLRVLLPSAGRSVS